MQDENWRKIPDFDYEVSSDGRIKSLSRRVAVRGGFRTTRERELSRCVSSSGYLLVGLKKDGKRHHFAVGVLVLTGFVGPRPPGLHMCHNNGVRTDDRLENLRWDTPAANMRDKVTHGTALLGSRHLQAKLTEAKVSEMRAKRGNGQTYQSLAKEYGVTLAVAREACLGITWKHVPSKLVPRRVPGSKSFG